MRQPSPSDEIAAVTRAFIRGLEPHCPQRVEAQISGPDGMPLLCAVESALAESLPARPAREFVWLSGVPSAGVHRLTLSAYGQGHELLSQAAHEITR